MNVDELWWGMIWIIMMDDEKYSWMINIDYGGWVMTMNDDG